MKYYTLEKKNLGYGAQAEHQKLPIREITYEDFTCLEKYLKDVHLNWQTDLQAMRKIEGIKYQVSIMKRSL
jgi:hypothetical protein